MGIRSICIAGMSNSTGDFVLSSHFFCISTLKLQGTFFTIPNPSDFSAQFFNMVPSC